MLLLRSCPLASPARLTKLGALASAGFLFAPALAWAEPSPALDRFSFSVGAFSADPKFNASVSSPYGALRTRDLEPGRVTMPRVTADLLIGDSHGLSFDYYRYKRDYFGQAAGSDSFGGFGTLSAVGNANINVKLDFAKLSYKWWLGSGNTVFGLGAGAAYYSIDVGTNANVAVNGRIRTLNEDASDNAVAPLLELGVRHAINPDLRHPEETAIPVEWPAGQVPITGGKPGRSEDVAEVIRFLVSDRARHITGSPIWIDGGQGLLR